MVPLRHLSLKFGFATMPKGWARRLVWGPGPLPRLSDTASSCPHAFSLIPAHALWGVVCFMWPWVGPAVLVSKTRRHPPRKVKQGFRIPTREPQLVPPGPLATPGTSLLRGKFVPSPYGGSWPTSTEKMMIKMITWTWHNLRFAVVLKKKTHFEL